MKLRSVPLIVFFVTIFSCRNTTEEKGNTANKTTRPNATNNPIKVSDIEPNLWKADSLQVLYYDNPEGDSLRYSRFFSYTATPDSNKINFLLNELDQRFVKQDNKKDCRSEGKLFLLNREEILKTIYFSTRGDSCSYMYFIKDGSFIYFPMPENARKFFRENKRFAKKP